MANDKSDSADILKTNQSFSSDFSLSNQNDFSIVEKKTKIDIAPKEHYTDDPILWKDGVGYLPGSVLKFKLDDNGELELFDEDCSHIQKKQKLMKDILSHENSYLDFIAFCVTCHKLEFKEDLTKSGQYCKDCSNIDPIQFKIFKNLFSPIETLAKICNPDTNINISSCINNSSQTLNIQFSWDTYLESTGSEPIPYNLFLNYQQYPQRKNGFEVGMKLEGIDPFHQSKFCVLSLMEIQGFRLRLHFDGYPSKFDFWVNADSEFIFPVGFCEKTGRKLEIPFGVNSFNWKDYLSSTNSKAAPINLFTISDINIDKQLELISAGFSINSKLEAVDKANTTLICVASVKDIMNDYILIHFDGWDDGFDYWVHSNSPLIRPVNWCKSKGKPLTSPKNYYKDKFIWEDYLKETNTVAVPSKAFAFIKKNKQKPVSCQWKPGSKLEAVDKRNPCLIRVATIVNRQSYSIRIHFDGWDDKYDYMIDDDSPDLHPINWCLKTNHKLEPPPVNDSPKSTNSCPIPECNNVGHFKWYLYKSHTSEKHCPYSEDNYNYELPDRFDDNSDSDDSDLEESQNDDTDNNMLSDSLEDSILPNLKKSNETKEHFHLKTIYENYTESINNGHHSLLASGLGLYDSLNICPKEVLNWDSTKVEQFVEKLTNNEHISGLFRSQCIDGQSFLLLKKEDLLNVLNIKIGPALKIYRCIVFLQEQLLQK